MKNKLARAMFWMAVIALLISFALCIAVFYTNYGHITRDELKEQAELAAKGVSEGGLRYLESLELPDTRVTWIDGSGTVLFDSTRDASEMENHADREEVREALDRKSGQGDSRRYSRTMVTTYLYAAQRLDDGTVIRLSRASHSVLAMTIQMIQPLCIVVLVSALLAAFLSGRLARKLVDPVNHLDLDHPLQNEQYDELAPLLRRIDHQQRQIRLQEGELNQRKEELNTIIDNMYEGLVLIGKRGNILSINHAAMRILGGDEDCIGRNILSINRNLEIQDSVSDALDGHESDRTVEIGDAIYQVTASPVEMEQLVRGAALMLIDVTEKENMEQVRREFSANVSHELRTPLHSISGYAELLKGGMVRDADIEPFAEKIYQEAQRMIRLVEDIINLSHLDEGAQDMEWQETDLAQIARATVESLRETAEQNQVTLSFEGEEAKIYGISHLLQEIVYNLCDNAIKYNKPGGTVDVRVHEKKEKVWLIVRDTGIGIPENQQERVFERFYRVDKSHSKEVGGTGLGLSIVKHAARVHGAKIEMKSRPGEGTAIKVGFPKKKLS